MARLSLYANEATLIAYEEDSGLLWWDGVPIGRLVDSGIGVGTVRQHVDRLHAADLEAQEARQAALLRRYGEH